MTSKIEPMTPFIQKHVTLVTQRHTGGETNQKIDTIIAESHAQLLEFLITNTQVTLEELKEVYERLPRIKSIIEKRLLIES